MERCRGLALPFSICALSLWLALLAPAAGANGTTTLDLKSLDDGLESIPFGVDSASLIDTWIKSRLESELEPKLKRTLDPHEREALRQGLRGELRALKAKVTRLAGERSTYDVSVIADEFKLNADQSVFAWRENDATHYFLFSHDQLWKYVRVYEDVSSSFALRGKDLRNRLGPNHRATPVTLEWIGPQNRIRLVDRRRLYGADLLIIEDAAIAAQITPAPKSAKGPEIDPEIRALLADPLDDPDTSAQPPARKR